MARGQRSRDRDSGATLGRPCAAEGFTDLVDLTVVTVAIPYLFSACAQLAFMVSGRRPVRGWLLARDLLVAGASMLFSMWVNFSAV